MNTSRVSLSAALLTTVLAASSCSRAPAATADVTKGPSAGYTLVAPSSSTQTFLIDLEGRVLHSWKSGYPGLAAYLLDNGTLLRSASIGPMGNGTFHGGGAGGIVEELDWNGNLLWRFEHSSDAYLLHHDIEPLPNGNVLMIAWEHKSVDEALAAGRDPQLVGPQGMWTDYVIEVKPTLPEGGEIVWEWHVWDHLVQNLDAGKPNFGNITEYPERIDINPPSWVGGLTDEQRKELEALGYIDAGSKPQQRQAHPDWNHTNAIDYNPRLDQIALSVLGQNEVWIIDHSTTTAEAAGSSGGRRGKGGDLLYRWGNPAVLGDENTSQTFFAQHDVHWIRQGLPGAGHLLLFNNGRGRPEGDYSTVDEIALPMSEPGVYERTDSGGFAPAKLVWTYAAPDKLSFHSPNVSGAQRSPTGTTLICSGAQVRFFEVSPEGETVWEYALASRGGMPLPLPVEPHSMDIDRVFDMIDADKDGSISRDEFRNAPMPGPPMGMPFDPNHGSRHPAGPGGPPGLNVFRILRYPPTYPAFDGKNLVPGPMLDEALRGEVRPMMGPGPRPRQH
jgi:hypothetical protein